MHSNGHGLFQLNVQHSPVVSNPMYVGRISMCWVTNLLWVSGEVAHPSLLRILISCRDPPQISIMSAIRS